MTSLPEQFQAARQAQIDRQFAFLRSLGDGVLDRTSRVFALNLDLSRATAEHSSNTMRQLLALRDPRDLLTIGAQSQRQLRTLFDYGHELFNIAAGLRGAALQTYSVEAAASAPALAAPIEFAGSTAEPLAEAVTEPVAESVQETVAASETVGEAAAETLVQPGAEPAGEPAALAAAPAGAAPVSVSAADVVAPIAVSDIAPPVEPTPIAKATSDILDVPLTPHPVAASVPVDVDVEIELPKVEPVDATPPVVPPTNGAPKVTEIRSGRGRRKGN